MVQLIKIATDCSTLSPVFIRITWQEEPYRYSAPLTWASVIQWNHTFWVTVVLQWASHLVRPVPLLFIFKTLDLDGGHTGVCFTIINFLHSSMYHFTIQRSLITKKEKQGDNYYNIQNSASTIYRTGRKEVGKGRRDTQVAPEPRYWVFLTPRGSCMGFCCCCVANTHITYSKDFSVSYLTF